jgi:hypothetical protein
MWKGRNMKIIKTILIAAAVLLGLLYFAHIVGAEAFVNTDKSDGECTGLETVGRCADKCPNQGDFVRGYDKETGAVICGHVTGCPYGDSIPLGAECDKHAPLVQSTTIEEPVTSPVDYPSEDFQGK